MNELLALNRAGYDVFARRVASADSLRHELHQSEWDLVIADYHLPRFDAFEALALVKGLFVGPRDKITPQEVAQAIGHTHQYPGGLGLFLGTMFAPTKDRFAPGQGFTHAVGDIVTIATPKLGSLVNRIRHTHDCAPWTFGASHLMRNLARRGLL